MHPTWAQAMISHFVSLSPTLGSLLTAQSLKPALDSGSPSLSGPSPLALCLSKINKHLKNILTKKKENPLLLISLSAKILHKYQQKKLIIYRRTMQCEQVRLIPGIRCLIKSSKYKGKKKSIRNKEYSQQAHGTHVRVMYFTRWR